MDEKTDSPRKLWGTLCAGSPRGWVTLGWELPASPRRVLWVSLAPRRQGCSKQGVFLALHPTWPQDWWFQSHWELEASRRRFVFLPFCIQQQSSCPDSPEGYSGVPLAWGPRSRGVECPLLEFPPQGSAGLRFLSSSLLKPSKPTRRLSLAWPTPRGHPAARSPLTSSPENLTDSPLTAWPSL